MDISVSSTACHYLFGKSANEIYGATKITEEEVNQNLEILMRVNIVFLSKKENDGFPFIDPAAFNNQCHIYAHLAARIRRNFKEKLDSEKREQTQENRFLHLSFILSYTFLTDRNLLCNVIENAVRKGEITFPPHKNTKQFYQFVKDSQGVLIRTARYALNEVFERTIKSLLAEAKDRSPLHRELYELSKEDLQMLPERGTKTMYTLPKLLGVAYLMNEKFSFVIKTKVITENGTGTLFYQCGPIDEDEEVSIFETVASDVFSLEEIRNMSERCPSYFERKPSKKHRHSEEEICHFCNPREVDLRSYQERFERATASIIDTFYALASDSIQVVEKPFLRFFNDGDKYPILTDIFQKAVSSIEELGVSMVKPLTFTVEHVYLDCGKKATSPEFRMNSSPEDFLRKRGYL